MDTSLKFSRNKAINILNSFTPQGSSPFGSIRITTVDKYLGVGYYKMISHSKAKLSTYLLNSDQVGLNTFTPPLTFDLNDSNINNLNSWTNSTMYSPDWIFPVLKEFGYGGTSRLLFSFLSGDNILIVHPDQEIRLKFLGFFLNILPSVVLKYNRITLGCSELDGNENIVGVDQLPQKYRSHKKLFLPLDTIFVDLESKKIEGEGIKKSTITDYFAERMTDDYSKIKSDLSLFFEKIMKEEYPDDFGVDLLNESLTERIQIKLKLKSVRKEQEWLMF